MENNGYSYEELTTPPILKFRKRMERQLGKVAKVLIAALEAEQVNFYPDHPTRIKAGTEIVRLSGGDPARKVEEKHEHKGTIFHDLTERLEKAIEATEDAIRGKGSRRTGKKD